MPKKPLMSFTKEWHHIYVFGLPLHTTCQFSRNKSTMSHYIKRKYKARHGMGVSPPTPHTHTHTFRLAYYLWITCKMYPSLCEAQLYSCCKRFLNLTTELQLKMEKTLSHDEQLISKLLFSFPSSKIPFTVTLDISENDLYLYCNFRNSPHLQLSAEQLQALSGWICGSNNVISSAPWILSYVLNLLKNTWRKRGMGKKSSEPQ